MRRDYKTPEDVRRRALEYYYENREEVLAKANRQRRAAGVPLMKDARRTVKRTREDRLKDVIYCNICGEQVTTPSAIVRRKHRCRHCLGEKTKLRYKARGLTSKGKVPKPKVETINHIQEFREFKAGLFCSRCGYDKQPQVLEFHHRDPSEKLFNISARKGAPLVKLMDEMLKCDILCPNCHREVHAEERRAAA